MRIVSVCAEECTASHNLYCCTAPWLTRPAKEGGRSQVREVRVKALAMCDGSAAHPANLQLLRDQAVPDPFQHAGCGVLVSIPEEDS